MLDLNGAIEHKACDLAIRVLAEDLFGVGRKVPRLLESEEQKGHVAGDCFVGAALKGLQDAVEVRDIFEIPERLPDRPRQTIEDRHPIGRAGAEAMVEDGSKFGFCQQMIVHRGWCFRGIFRWQKVQVAPVRSGFDIGS